MIPIAVFIFACTLICARTGAFTPSLSPHIIPSPHVSTKSTVTYSLTHRYHKCHHLQQHCFTGSLHASSKSSTDEGKPTVEKDDEDEKKFSMEEVAQVIEVSFVEACLQLAKGYVDVQKLFLAAVKSCHDNNVPLSRLLRTVNNIPQRSANRDLTSEEIYVRTISMALVYLTLEAKIRLEGKEPRYFDDDSGDGDNKEDDTDEVLSGIANTYGDTIEERVRDSLEMEKLKNGSGGDTGASAEKDPMQVALMAHYGKAVISLTMQVIKEEEACYGDGLTGKKPRPPIPGAS